MSGRKSRSGTRSADSSDRVSWSGARELQARPRPRGSRGPTRRPAAPQRPLPRSGATLPARPPGTERRRTPRKAPRRRSCGGARGRVRRSTVWPCRRPSLDTRASSRSRRSPRPETPPARATDRFCRPRWVRRARAASVGSCRPTSDGHGLRRRHQLAGQVMRGGLGDPGVDERSRLERVGDVHDPVGPGSSLCRGPSLAGPSTGTSNVAPTCASERSSEIRCCSSTSRSKRSWTTAFGIWSSNDAARVPGRGEYWNVYALSNRARSTRSSVSAKSSSVSPGNPTMTSVDTATSGMARRIASSHPR